MAMDHDRLCPDKIPVLIVGANADPHADSRNGANRFTRPPPSLRFRHTGGRPAWAWSRTLSQLVGDAVLVADILQGLVAVAEFVAYWRFVVCFTPASALSLFLYFSIPDRLAGITVAALVLTRA